MKSLLNRHPENPIVTPGGSPYRRVSSFNPGVALADNGDTLLYERAAGSLRPFQTSIGLLRSSDGHFDVRNAREVITGDMIGFPHGSVEDARVSRIDGTYYLVYALQPYHFDCWPNGIGVPEYYADHHREWKDAGLQTMMTQSGIATSADGTSFTNLGFTTPREIDDRDNVLFPRKIGGEYMLLRRPQHLGKPLFNGTPPGVMISMSRDLIEWSEPRPVAASEQPWEGTKIGAATTPIETEEGWLLIYHGVDQTSTYRVGLMLLDLDEPWKVLARTRSFVMEPVEYYEKFGLVIPNVIFPTDVVVRDDEAFIYYGCCDTSISLATAGVRDLIRACKDSS